MKAFEPEGIREALAAKIKGRIAAQVNMYDGYVPTTPALPAILVQPAPDYITFEKTFGGVMCEVRFDITLLVSPELGTKGQRLIDQFLSVGAGQRNSVYDALQDSPTLGDLLAEDLDVTDVQYQFRELWGAPDSQLLVDRASISLTARQLAKRA